MKWSDGLVEDNRTIVEILKEAKNVIENPENWCQGVLYQREDGSSAISAHGAGVCRFCSIGAIHKVVPWGRGKTSENIRKAITYLNRAIDLNSHGPFGATIGTFNDTNPHSEVMKMWDDAIRIAKGEHESNIQ